MIIKYMLNYVSWIILIIFSFIINQNLFFLNEEFFIVFIMIFFFIVLTSLLKKSVLNAFFFEVFNKYFNFLYTTLLNINMITKSNELYIDTFFNIYIYICLYGFKFINLSLVFFNYKKIFLSSSFITVLLFQLYLNSYKVKNFFIKFNKKVSIFVESRNLFNKIKNLKLHY